MLTTFTLRTPTGHRRIDLPPGVTFADLQLTREHGGRFGGRLRCNPDTVQRVADASGLDVQTLAGPALVAFIGSWYSAHIDYGGEPDPVFSAMLARAAERTRH